jgi:hypothetical protein
MGNTYAINVRAVRRFTALEEGGKRVAVRLHVAANTSDVFWSARSCSYVVNDNPTGQWSTPDGTPCDLLSINGIGEIRWAVSSPDGNTAGDLEAVEYFGLTWHGYRGSR